MSGLTADYVEDPITRIVSITINIAPDTIRFLYSDNSGMYGSKDGRNWTPAPSSVAAFGMAYGDKVWVAIAAPAAGSTTGWRSEDYGATWEEISLPELISHIAFLKPKPGSDNKERPGVFAIFSSTDSFYGGTNKVYISTDQGKGWREVLTVPDDKTGTCLQAAGDRLFIPVWYYKEHGWNPEGWVYSSADGESWSLTGVFTGATSGAFPPRQQYSYGAAGVGYDPLLKTYYYIGFEQSYTRGGANDGTDYIIYATSTDGISFGGKTIMQEAYLDSSGNGSTLFVWQSAAGGMGAVATPGGIDHDPGNWDGGVEGIISGGTPQIVLEFGPVPGGFGTYSTRAHQCCYVALPGYKAETAERGQGVFAFCAFNFSGNGGVYVSNGGGWSQGKAGTPLGYEPGSGIGWAGLATGHLPWLDEGPPP